MDLNKKILVVEDDWDINGLLCKMLIQNGYEVTLNELEVLIQDLRQRCV